MTEHAAVMTPSTQRTGAIPATAPGDTTLRAAALAAAIGYASIFVLAIFANFAVRMRLLVPDDATATMANIAGAQGVFRLALAAFLVVFLLDVVVAWALYILLSPAGPRRSLLAAWFRLTYTVFMGAAITFLYLARTLAAGGEANGVMLAMDAFDITWLVGLSAFGVHLVLVGRLLLSSRRAPRALGVVLTVAGAAYVIDTLARLALAGYAQYADLFLVLVFVPSVVGELAFTVWLFTRARGALRSPVASR